MRRLLTATLAVVVFVSCRSLGPESLGAFGVASSCLDEKRFPCVCYIADGVTLDENSREPVSTYHPVTVVGEYGGDAFKVIDPTKPAGGKWIPVDRSLLLTWQQVTDPRRRARLLTPPS